MEARASLSGASVSRTFVAAILVIVALGLTAMGGYVAQSLSHGGAATQGQTYAAPGTVLRQDNPSQGQTYVAPGTVLRQDNPSQPVAGPAQERSTGHKELP